MRSYSPIPSPIADLPWRMLLLVTFITGFGLLVLYSAAGAHLMPWALPQGVRFVVFLGMAIAISRVKPQTLRDLAFPAYGAVMMLLILVQPDLGTATMVLAGGITIMFLAGLPLRLFLGGAALLAIVGPVAFSFLHDYQQKRVLIFLDPESDPLGAGYHISQSKIAIGSGGVFGKGFLNGTQSHLDYLPEGHTDFIFATMAEEWGLIGGILLITAYAFVIRWGVGVALEAKDRFQRLAAAGLTTTIFLYVAINLMMVMGLAPVVGIPLPLFSYGGSAMLTVMLCLGALMSIERHSRGERRRL